MYDKDRLKSDLANAALPFCKYLFPAGKHSNGEYSIGSLNGDPGNSLKIRISGLKTGLWKDFATGEGGSNLLDLLYKVRGGDFYDSCREASEFLNHPIRSQVKSVVSNAWKTLKSGTSLSFGYDFKDFQPGKADDYNTLSETLGIGVDGLLLATEAGVLKFFHHFTNGRCWSAVDRQNFVRQDRRLDGKPFRLQDGRTTKSRTIGSPSYPIGLPTDKPIIMLVEGSSDLLAAYALIHGEHMEGEVAPVAILGASNIIHDSALPYFKGKYVLGFPDYDKAGIAGMTRWQRQLKNVVAEFRVFDYHGLTRDDGEKIKDVRDFLRIDVDQWEGDGEVRSPLGNFMAELFREDAIHATD